MNNISKLNNPTLKNEKSQCLNDLWSCKSNLLNALNSHWSQDIKGLCSCVFCLISRGRALVLNPHLSQIKLSLCLPCSWSFTSFKFVCSFCLESVLAICVCNSMILSLWNLFCSLNNLFSVSFSLIVSALERISYHWPSWIVQICLVYILYIIHFLSLFNDW